MNYYEEIKNKLINNEVYKKVKDYSKNKSDLDTYYNVGKLLAEAGKHYGEGIIKEYSLKLMNEVGKKYSIRYLFKIKQFYNLFSNTKVSAMPTQLSWSHYTELLVLKNSNEINYYINRAIYNNLTYRELRNIIKNDEYKRLPEDTKNKLLNEDKVNIKDLVPNPILIKNKSKKEVISEKMLHQLILEDIETFMKNLGIAYAFIGSEYKIKIGNIYNYIDLLLYNIKFKCYVVVELKITELKAEHVGQIQKYMNYIDKNIKTFDEDKTIGVIICKKDNKFVMEYCSDKRILSREYEVI